MVGMWLDFGCTQISSKGVGQSWELCYVVPQAVQQWGKGTKRFTLWSSRGGSSDIPAVPATILMSGVGRKKEEEEGSIIIFLRLPFMRAEAIF